MSGIEAWETQPETSVYSLQGIVKNALQVIKIHLWATWGPRAVNLQIFVPLGLSRESNRIECFKLIDVCTRLGTTVRLILGAEVGPCGLWASLLLSKLLFLSSS